MVTCTRELRSTMLVMMIMVMILTMVGPKPVQYQILLLGQFLRQLFQIGYLLLTMMVIVSVITVVMSRSLMDRQRTGSRVVALVP